MRGVRVSRPVDRDMSDIWHYVANQSGSLETADRLVESISSTFALFARAPEIGTMRDDIASGVRGFPVGDYIIYYAVTERYIVVSRVPHGMQDQRSAYNNQRA